MDKPAPAPFTKRTAMWLLVAAVFLFVVGVVSLALGWIEVATACAAIYAVGWLGLRSRVKRVKAEAKRAEEEAQAAAQPERTETPPPGAPVRSRRPERRRPRP